MNNIDNKANALAIIEKNSRDFGGDLNDTQCAAAANISPKTFYKYKFQLRVQKLMREAPLLTEENYEAVLPAELPYGGKERREYFEDLQACAGFLRQNYPDVVTGLFFIKEPADDGGTQFIIRFKEEFPAKTQINAVGKIFDFTEHEMSYSFSNDDMDNLHYISIEEWLSMGEIYTVYDSEREQ